jgi:NAD(P)H-dependent flavin oxidoreductase YrpB (nitropropane dioxygenase family)
MPWRAMVRDGLAMRHGKDLSWSQVLMAANTPMLLKASMVDGRPDLGLMTSGQVAGLIDDLPSADELITRIINDAVAVLTRLGVPSGAAALSGASSPA